MYDPAVLRFALLSGLIGFAAFCISYALLVWRRRNTSARGSQAPRSEKLRRWAACLFLAGGIAVGIALAVRELDRAEGVLAGDGLFAIRTPGEEFRLTYLADSRTVGEGDLLARLESPEATAEVRQFELEGRRLEKERDALLLDCLKLDPEMVRRHQNAITMANRLQASVDQLLPARESLLRQATLERLDRQETRTQLEIDIAWYEGELERATRELSYVQRDLERVNPLIEQNAVTEAEVDSRRRQADELSLEVANLRERVDGLKKREAQIDRSLQEIATLLEEQTETLGSELDRARTDRVKAASQTEALAECLDDDLDRARQFRQRELEQLDLELQQCQAQREGVEQTLEIRAPHAGTVVFRDPSPRSAEEQRPLFVLAKSPGFRLQAKLPRGQLASLAAAGDVTIELLDPFVEPFFVGRFLQARPMPRKPNYVVADLACQPPEEAIRELLEGEKIVARLQWRPPLTTLLPFQVGAVLLLAGGMLWLITLVHRPRRKDQTLQSGSNGHGDAKHESPVPEAAMARARRSQLPVRRKTDLESGPVAVLHELLGERLREGVLRDEVDSDLLSALEWALDRHHSRAVRQIRAGLRSDDVFEKRVHQLHEEVAASHSCNGKSLPMPDKRERVLRVLQTVLP